MRLTIINQFYTPDLAPTGHMAASLAEHRAARGDDVTVITSTGGYVPQSPVERRSAETNPRVHRLWTPRAGKRTPGARLVDYAVFFLAAAVRASTLPRQDLLIALTTPPFIAWTAVMHRVFHPGARIVLWSMDCYPEIAERTRVLRAGGLTSRFLRWLNRRLFRRLDGVICLDPAMRSLLEGAYEPASDGPQWFVIPNWEPADQFPANIAPPVWPMASGLGLEGQFVILYLGNAGFGHRFETVLDAAERLRDQPFVWLFVGGGSQWGWLAQEVGKRRLDRVHVVPYVPKEATPSVMASAGCALITLGEEAVGVISPSKLHANLAMGLPILYVGPPGSNVDLAIDEFGVGASLRSGDVEGIVGFVERLANEPAFARELRGRARRAFEHAYSDAVTLPAFDRALDQVFSPGAPRRGG
jgi:colanic acid biosynthesis glycosyl transferase WcaI